MWRYIFVIMLVLIVLFIVLFVKSELSLDVKQIRYVNYKYQKYDAFRQKTGEIFEQEWNELHPDEPVHVIYEPVGGGYSMKLNSQLVGNTLPDVMALSYSFVPFAKNGALLDLTPLIDKYDDWDYIEQIYPELIEYHKFGKKIYGLPGNLQVFVLFYNKRLFDQAGISYPDASWTWEDVREAAIELTKRDSSGYLQQAGLSWYFDPANFTLMNGGQVLNEQRTSCVINNPQALQAAQFYDQLLNKDRVIPSVAEEQMEQGKQTFKNNRMAMIVTERWFTAELNDLKDVDWGVTPSPISLSGKRLSQVRFNNMAINAKTRHPDLAYKYLLHIIGQKQIQRLVQFGDSIPIRHGSQANEYFYTDPDRPVGENLTYRIAMEDGTYTNNDLYPRAVPQTEAHSVYIKWRDRWLAGDVAAAQMLVEVEDELNALIQQHTSPVKTVAILPFIGRTMLLIGLPLGLILFLLNRKKLQARMELRKAGVVKPRYQYSGYFFLMPNFIGVMTFIIMPVIFSFFLAFCDWNLINWPPRFVGLANFKSILSDIEGFWQYLFNTAFYMLGIPLGIIGSLVMAILLNQKIRGRNLFRAVYFMPSFAAGVALLVLWKWIYNTDGGLLNTTIKQLGHLLGTEWTGPDWLRGKPFLKFATHFKLGYAKPAIMLMGLWCGIGGTNMILYLAGLQGINPELYEVAAIDGANGWQKFKNITWPMLSPTTFFILVMAVIGGFQGGFQAAFVMTGGGPDQATTTISFGIFNNAFVNYQMGKAAAISWILFVLVFIFTLVNWKLGAKKVHYE
jgi:ABC-type sugar transport system permease subunit/ABC-type glycerol-3-phosphate transport system substrate-binding protein